jgi:hypothetical protein
MSSGIPAKYPGTCTACGLRFKAGTYITWDPATKKAQHFQKCPELSYDGTEQKNTFDAWIEAFKSMEGK